MSISKKTREKVYRKYDGRCAYCGRPIAFKDMQVDHFIPQSMECIFVANELILNKIADATGLPPHGDLIDKSELLENSKVNGMYPHWIDTMDVKRAPVVVPAERRDEL